GWIAGAPVRVRVEPLDAFGNVVLADTATIVMRPSGALRWAPAFGALSGGAFVTFASDTIAESVSLAADRVGGGTGSAGPAVVANVPATARDLFGNLAPGAAVTFYVGAPSAGTLESLGSTSGGSGSQSGTTGGAGALAVRYRAPATTPAADSIFARGASIA